MEKVKLTPLYHRHIRRVERACQYIWMSARGSEEEPTLYGDAVAYAKEVLNSYTSTETPFVENGLAMYADELERLSAAEKILGVLVAEFTEPFTGYKHVSNPEVLMGLAAELWGEKDG